MTTTENTSTETKWTQRVVRHPHGPTSLLWVSHDGKRYKVFEHGPEHPMNRLVVDTDGGTS